MALLIIKSYQGHGLRLCLLTSHPCLRVGASKGVDLRKGQSPFGVWAMGVRKKVCMRGRGGR